MYCGAATICQLLCCRWIDAGKFLTGFSAIGSIAVPAILFHSQVKSFDVWHLKDLLKMWDVMVCFVDTHLLHKYCCCNIQICVILSLPNRFSIGFVFLQKIAAGALWTELAAVVVLGATVFAFDYFNSTDSGYYTY